MSILFGCSTGSKPPAVKPAPQAQSQLAGSNATLPMIITARRMLQLWYYKGCDKINILELVSLSPEAMRGKDPLIAGDKWTEKWKIDACGTVAVHPIEFELIQVGAQISTSENVKPAE